MSQTDPNQAIYGEHFSPEDVIKALEHPHVIQSDQVFVFLESPIKGLISKCGGAPPVVRLFEDSWRAVDYVEDHTVYWTPWRGEAIWTKEGKAFVASLKIKRQDPSTK